MTPKRRRRLGWWFLFLAAIAAACARSEDGSAPPATGPAPISTARPTFVNRVWSVSESSAVARGTLYVFLSDGTLVITSRQTKPLVGEWKKTDHGLVMIEESLSYPTEILELTADSFVIRSHNPGQPVDISFVPAAPEIVPSP
jgi:hypothetical protein